MIAAHAVRANHLGLFARVARAAGLPGGKHYAAEYNLALGQQRPETAYQPRRYAPDAGAR